MRKFCAFLLLFPILVFGGGVYLINDSTCTLRVVIRAHDGTYLGEQIMNAQQTGSWSNSYGTGGRYGPGTVNIAPMSQTPYTVTWYTMDGKSYSFCDNVGTGNTVTAQGCTGSRTCPPPPPQGAPQPNQPESYLEGQNNAYPPAQGQGQ
jgi:hypothetical protein